MKRRVWTGTCAAIVSLFTAGMMAQATTQSPTPQQSTPSSSSNKVTVTGCLKAAPTSPSDTAAADAPTGTAGTTGSAAPTTSGTAGTNAATPTEPKFILTAATLVPADSTGAASASATPGASSTAGTSGTSATSSAPGTPSAASASSTAGASTAQTYRLIANPAALTAHVGKKLELTGTIDTTSTADPKDPSAAAPALRVESGKIVGASCSE